MIEYTIPLANKKKFYAYFSSGSFASLYSRYNRHSKEWEDIYLYTKEVETVYDSELEFARSLAQYLDDNCKVFQFDTLRDLKQAYQNYKMIGELAK